MCSQGTDYDAGPYFDAFAEIMFVLLPQHMEHYSQH